MRHTFNPYDSACRNVWDVGDFVFFKSIQGKLDDFANFVMTRGCSNKEDSIIVSMGGVIYILTKRYKTQKKPNIRNSAKTERYEIHQYHNTTSKVCREKWK